MKKPEFITFTGIDDATDLVAARALAAEYPVEYGVLFSPERQGNSPRYPNWSTIGQILLFAMPGSRYAAHLCGGYSRLLLASASTTLDSVLQEHFTGIRTVDLNDDALRAAEAQRLITGGKGSRMFLNPRDGKPWSTDAQIRKTLWVPLCARAEIEYRNPYQVRHTYASTLLTDGHNPWYVAAQLGHEDVQMVFRTYGKFIREDYQKPRPELRAVSGA